MDEYLKKLKVNQDVLIHSYKHNGNIHRCWERATVLDIREDACILITVRCQVIESDGRCWYTQEPAICYHPFDKWYNVIAMIRDDGVYYYCNIASPSLYDGEAIKYIDYDLDLKVYPDGHYKVLDEEEYKSHARKMEYGEDLDRILRKQLNDLIELADNKQGPFKKGFANYWYDFYQSLRFSR